MLIWLQVRKVFQDTAHDLGTLRQCSGCKPTDQSCVVCDEFGCTSCAHDTLCTKCVIDADRSKLFMMAPQLGGMRCGACLGFFWPSGAPASLWEIGVHFFDIFVSFEFSRDRHFHWRHTVAILCHLIFYSTYHETTAPMWEPATLRTFGFLFHPTTHPQHIPPINGWF